MAFTRLFLQDDSGSYSSAVAAHFSVLPKPGSILNVPGRPSILIQSVRPALFPREDGEAGIPACVYAVPLNAAEAAVRELAPATESASLAYAA